MKHQTYYMDVALLSAKNSYAERKKVGCCIVTESGVLLTGWNGTPTGFDNTCEGEDGLTLPTVIHAELNAMSKAAKEGVSLANATLYVTLSPCNYCTNLIIQSGIKEVVYVEEYQKGGRENLRTLEKAGVATRKHILRH